MLYETFVRRSGATLRVFITYREFHLLVAGWGGEALNFVVGLDDPDEALARAKELRWAIKAWKAGYGAWLRLGDELVELKRYPGQTPTPFAIVKHSGGVGLEYYAGDGKLHVVRSDTPPSEICLRESEVDQIYHDLVKFFCICYLDGVPT